MDNVLSPFEPTYLTTGVGRSHGPLQTSHRPKGPSVSEWLAPIVDGGGISSRHELGGAERPNFVQLLAGLQDQGEEQAGSGPVCTQETTIGETLAETSEQTEGAIKNVATPASRLSTLAETGSEVLMKGGKHTRTAQRLSGLDQATGKFGQTTRLAAQPFAVANSVRTLADGEASAEDKGMAGLTLANETAHAAKTFGAAASTSGELSSVKAIATAQKGVASAAPKVASTLGTVGRAAPVVGGALGVVSGGLQIRDAVTNEDGVDKAGLASGALKVASGVALVVPGGLPVSAALGLTAMAIDHREKIGEVAKGVGRRVAEGVENRIELGKKGVEAVGRAAGAGADLAARGAGAVVDQTKKNVETASRVVGAGAEVTARGAKAVVGQAQRNVETATRVVGAGVKGARKVGGEVKSRVKKGAKAVGRQAAEAGRSVAKKTVGAAAKGATKFGKGLSAIHRRFSRAS